MWDNHCNSSWVCCYVTRVISLYVSLRRCLSPLCCLAGETWTSRGLCVDPSSGMESLSVKSVSADGPGPAGSSTTPTHAPICAHSQLTAMQNTLSLPGTRIAAPLQMKHIYGGCHTVWKKLPWTLFGQQIQTQDLGVPKGRGIVVVCECVCSRDGMTTPDLLFPVELGQPC